MPHLENILGALALTLSDRLTKGVVQSSHFSEGIVVALNHIENSDQPTIEDLRASLDVKTHSAATRIVAQLEEKQLVTKNKSKSDNRFVRLGLTPKGKEKRADVLAKRELFLVDALSSFNDEERKILETLIKKILAGLPFDRQSCDRCCRLCDPSICPEPNCPVQVKAS